MIKPETVGIVGGVTSMNTQRLYGCQSDVVYGRSQLCDGIFFSCPGNVKFSLVTWTWILQGWLCFMQVFLH